MTQEAFDRSVEEAQAWMEAVQQRLQVSDNTQGPRAALEARLRETEKICQVEPEGHLKVELVLSAAEALLACCPEDQRPAILARLRDVKAQWEETVTYMVHCHSRIEWVWLHWSEYLLARDEFYRWFQKMMATLEPQVELQLGLKEKQWQLSHAQVLLNNVDNQAVLLDRLLEEAASLFNRIGDPSVDEEAQKRMQAEYDAVRLKAQDRVDLLQKMTQEHAQYQADLDEFQLWLQAVMSRVDGCLGHARELTTQHRLSILQDLAKELPTGEQSLTKLEEQSLGVIRNTSPLGAEKITGELEELRKYLEKLRGLCVEEEERFQSVLKSQGACEQQIKELEAELGEFHKGLQRLTEEDLQPSATGASEDELVARWRRYSTMRATLAAEEPRVDRLQAQLKDLLVFSQDLRPLSDGVVAALQEYQSMKGKTTRLRNAAGVELEQRLRRPLQDVQLWRELAQRLLDITASLPDLPSIHTFLPQIEAALAESSRLKEQLTMLQLKTDLLGSVLGQEPATGLLEQVGSAVRDRDLLHNSLLQRKSKLQSLLSQHRDFGAAFELLQKQLSALQARVHAEHGLQPDLPMKKAQLSRLQGLQEESLDLGVQMEAVRPLIQGNPNHQHKMDQLGSDFQTLQRSLENLMEWSRQAVREHSAFSLKVLELCQGVSELTQKLEAQRGDAGPCSLEAREAEIERLLAELPEKEAQLSLTEARGRLVMEGSSPEGAVVVREQLEELAAAWRALRLQEERLLGLLRDQKVQGTQVDAGKRAVFTNNIPKSGFLINPLHPVLRHRRQGNPLQEDNNPEDFSQLLQGFERWLQEENSKLVRIISLRAAKAKDLRAQHMKLQELEARVPEGQHLFENLIRHGPARGTSDELEDLRYRWMLYKSKLKDSSHLLAQSPPGELTGFRKVQRRGLGSLSRKVCCAALPLQLLLLLLLLLLFLLPVGDDARSCTAANTFARSFKLMLHHQGPPPT
ncbi:PREDICTED: nesprin-3 [Elephantulus edwardii]|uniref:nesprin-3 n=1 Tax=Elephantulus edwardii TaxID=28737 RepID=UPI0003F0BF7C|nr:PREDICTED: nesprin-3 [Elephantulus edwardii]